MTVRIRHQLMGYDRTTRLLAVEYDIDQAIFRKIKKIANVVPEDGDAIGSYPLGNAQLRAIADLIGKTFDSDRFQFFLEPVAEPRTPA